MYLGDRVAVKVVECMNRYRSVAKITSNSLITMIRLLVILAK